MSVYLESTYIYKLRIWISNLIIFVLHLHFYFLLNKLYDRHFIFLINYFIFVLDDGGKICYKLISWWSGNIEQIQWSNTVTEKPLCFEVFPKKDTIMSVTYYLK